MVDDKIIKPEDVTPALSEKILSFLNSVRNPEEIASVVEVPGRDVGVKISESLLDRRAHLGGFRNLNQVADTPQIGEVRFSQIVKSLEVRNEPAISCVIEGQLKTARKFDFAGEKLAVHAVINGIDVASAEVDPKGKYQIGFKYSELPPSTELRVLPAGLPLRTSDSLAITKMVSFARYSETKQAYRAVADFMLPTKYLVLWGKVTKTYHMNGVVYATTFAGGFPISVEPLPAAKASR